MWGLSAIGVFYFSGLPRFLLSVFPLALACIAAGIDSSQEKGWKITNLFATALVIVLWISGGAGLLLYSWKPVATAVGIVGQATYLKKGARNIKKQRSSIGSSAAKPMAAKRYCLFDTCIPWTCLILTVIPPQVGRSIQIVSGLRKIGKISFSRKELGLLFDHQAIRWRSRLHSPRWKRRGISFPLPSWWYKTFRECALKEGVQKPQS